MTHDQKIELLKLLKEYPMSTTAFLFKSACECSTSQIPDPSSLSKIIYEARGKGLLTSSVGGKVKCHQITGKGVEELMKNEQKNVGKVIYYDDDLDKFVMTTEPSQPIEPTEHEQTDQTCYNSYTLDSAINTIQSEFNVVRAKLFAEQTKNSKKIEHKQQKIDTLSRLGALMSDDIKLIFDQIISDLEA